MSSTATSTEPFRRETPAEDVFAEVIESRAGICNCCFARPHCDDVDDTQVDQVGTTGERVVFEPGPSGGASIEPLQKNSAKYDWYPHDICPECGSPGLQSPTQTLSVDAAVDRAVELSRRLTEAGFVHDWRELVYCVKRLKETDGIHTKDRDIAASAVKIAVRRGRERRAPTA